MLVIFPTDKYLPEVVFATLARIPAEKTSPLEPLFTDLRGPTEHPRHILPEIALCVKLSRE